MSSWAAPGVKCVCVEDEGFSVAGKYGMMFPVKGLEYTVRGVSSFGTYGLGLLLVEVANPIARWQNGVHEAAWNIDCFRPLITQEQDLALFRHLLSPSPADVGLIPAGVELDA